jgi:hypothetical protein
VLTPTWLTNALAIVMLAVAAYCASRLVVARLTHRRTHYSYDAVHTAMGVAMAAMLTSRLSTSGPWVALFAVAAGWFGLRAARVLRHHSDTTAVSAGSYVRHLVTSGAMVFMLVVAPSAAFASTSSATPAMTMTSGAARFPTLALALGAFMVGYTAVILDRISRPSSDVENPAGATILAPRTVACCQVAMNLTMGYMLVALL